MARWQPARADVIAEYAREVLDVHPRGRVIVGLDGIESIAPGTETAAREAFASDLAEAFMQEGVPAVAVPMGRFAVEPQATSPESLYDEAEFRTRVLTPYRKGAPVLAETRLPSGWKTSFWEPGERAVLVISGAFLHFGDWAGIWHTSAWLQVPREVAAERDAARLPGVDEAPWTALVDLAFRRLDARTSANATFDLTDPARPRRVFADAC